MNLQKHMKKIYTSEGHRIGILIAQLRPKALMHQSKNLLMIIFRNFRLQLIDI